MNTRDPAVPVSDGLIGGFTDRLRAAAAEARATSGEGAAASDYLRALRPHHWTKNLLVFAPVIAAQETSLTAWLMAAGMFGAISLTASGAYLFNDLLDLPHDRRHPTKRHRPLAAGKLPVAPVIGLGVALMATGPLLGFALSGRAGLSVLLYLAGTLAYSVLLKRKAVVDIFALGALYATRVLAGAAAASVLLSPPFLAFFGFLFVALAVVKRQSELRRLEASEDGDASARPYSPQDLPVLAGIGAASAFASVVVLTFYLQSPELSRLYDRPELLWLIGPLLLYWQGRMSLRANRGLVDDDPIVFTLRDRTSWLVCLALLVVFILAS